MYKKLKNLQPFNQDVLIDKLKETYGTSETEKDIITQTSDGICYMLSIEWALNLLDDKTIHPTKIFNTDFDKKENLAYYKQIANNFYEYIKKIPLTSQQISPYRGLDANSANFRRNSIEFQDYLYVNLCSKGKHNVNLICYGDTNYGFNDRGDDFVGIISMLGTNAKDKKRSFGHEMAVCKIKDNSFFFDPNFGIFKVKNSNELITEITNLYTKTPDDRIKLSVAYIV